MVFPVFWIGLRLYKMFFNKTEILSKVDYLKTFMTSRVKVFETKKTQNWIFFKWRIHRLDYYTKTKMMALFFRFWPTKISRPLKNYSEMSNMSHNNFPWPFFPCVVHSMRLYMCHNTNGTLHFFFSSVCRHGRMVYTVH